MATTRQDIQDWIDRGLSEGASHLVVVCDTFDYEDYPVFCTTVEEAKKRYNEPGSMQKVMEVYKLSGDIEEQLDRKRCFEF